MTKYVEKFILPTMDMEQNLIDQRMDYNGGPFGYIDNLYPCRIFTAKELSEVDFENITIFYGGNGSGKSTLLNLIANKLRLKRIAPFNNSELFDSYVEACKVRMAEDEDGDTYDSVPLGSRIITSDDIFDYMLTARENNTIVADNTKELKTEWADLKYGKTIKLNGLENYEEFSKQVDARRKSLSRRKFVYKLTGKEVKLNSNGETALDFFENKLSNDCLYCLDEPENSLSPKFQQELVEIIERKARYCGCQFIIATHSPFVLSLKGAKIYDLDSVPVDIKKWWELENTKLYFEFFKNNASLFESEFE